MVETFLGTCRLQQDKLKLRAFPPRNSWTTPCVLENRLGGHTHQKCTPQSDSRMGLVASKVLREAFGHETGPLSVFHRITSLYQLAWQYRTVKT